MLTLAAAGTIAGVDFAAANKITYTICGVEVSSGVETYKVLAQGQLGTSSVALYTAPSSTIAIIKSIHLVNTDTVVQTAFLYANGTSGASAVMGGTKIPAGGWAVYGDNGWRIYDSLGQRQFTIAGLSYPGGAASFRSTWNFDTNTSAGPSTGSFRFSTTTPTTSADVMSVYVAYNDNGAIDRSAFFQQLTAAVNKQDCILSILLNDTSVAGYRFRVTAVTDNGTYFTLAVVALVVQAADALPTLSASMILQFDVAGKGQAAIMPPPNVQGTMYGFPGFNPSIYSAIAIPATRLVLIPFWTDVPLMIAAFFVNIATVGATNTSARVGLYRMKQRPNSQAVLGNKITEAAWASVLGTSTGVKSVSINTLIPAGYYWAAMAFPAVSGGTMNNLQGCHDQGILIDGSGATPLMATQIGNTGTDYTGGLPAENTAIGNNATTNFSATAMQFPAPFWMSYRPQP